MNACLRAACILIMYAPHVTSKSHDIHIYAQVVNFNRVNAVDTNMDIEARAELMKFEVAPESIRVRMGSGIPWNLDMG